MSWGPHTVYFVKPVGMDGPIKIGCTRCVPNRVRDLSIWSPFPLEVLVTIPGSITLENKIHNRFAYAHSHREWFRPVPDLLELVGRLREGMDINDAVDLSSPTGKIRSGCTMSPTALRCRGYRTRLAAAVRRAEKQHPKKYFWPPNDIAEIMDRWSRDGSEPTALEMARIHDAIANPTVHFNQGFRADIGRKRKASTVVAETVEAA